MEDEIVVTGKRLYVDNQLWWWNWDMGGGGSTWNYWGDGGGGGGGGGTGSDEPPPPPPDEAQIEVVVKLGREPTAREQRAIDNLKTKIAEQTEAINKLADNAQIKLKNGDVITGAELKQIWSKTDFTINLNEKYDNNSYRGEANYNGGDPKVAFNIGTLVDYDNATNGMAYLIAHELGHMTQAGRNANSAFDRGTITNDQNERVANDIARAIVNAAGGTPMNNPGSGYSTDVEEFFTSPPGAAHTVYNGSTGYDHYAGYNPGYSYASIYYNPDTGYYQPNEYSGYVGGCTCYDREGGYQFQQEQHLCP